MHQIFSFWPGMEHMSASMTLPSSLSSDIVVIRYSGDLMLWWSDIVVIWCCDDLMLWWSVYMAQTFPLIPFIWPKHVLLLICPKFVLLLICPKHFHLFCRYSPNILVIFSWWILWEMLSQLQLSEHQWVFFCDHDILNVLLKNHILLIAISSPIHYLLSTIPQLIIHHSMANCPPFHASLSTIPWLIVHHSMTHCLPFHG